MKIQGLVITILIGVIIGLVIAFNNNWTEWWQIALSMVSAICTLFVLIGITCLLVCVIILYNTQKWWKKHGNEFIDDFEHKLFNTARTVLRTICTAIFKPFR